MTVKAEERKYDHSDKFGEGESMRTCTQISKETGTSIEFSTSKDKSLTFMITGKRSNVLEAKRRVLTNFQTQVHKRFVCSSARCVYLAVKMRMNVVLCSGERFNHYTEGTPSLDTG